MDKPTRKRSEYQQFVSDKIKEGLTMKQIGPLWQRHKVEKQIDKRIGQKLVEELEVKHTPTTTKEAMIIHNRTQIDKELRRQAKLEVERKVLDNLMKRSKDMTTKLQTFSGLGSRLDKLK